MPQESLVGLEPKYGVLHQIVFWVFTGENFYMIWHEMIDGGKKNLTLRELSNSELSKWRYEF